MVRSKSADHHPLSGIYVILFAIRSKIMSQQKKCKPEKIMNNIEENSNEYKEEGGTPKKRAKEPQQEKKGDWFWLL